MLQLGIGKGQRIDRGAGQFTLLNRNVEGELLTVVGRCAIEE